jgi:phage tail sheath protein FI
LPTYETPGVYYERVDAAGPAIAAVRTDVAGFVGIASRGPVDAPVPVQSWRQFMAYFGDFTGQGFLAYAARGFFENGGRRCWIVRVASNDPAGGAATAFITLRFPAPPGSPPGTVGTAAWVVEAFSPGVWGNDLSVLIEETRRAQTVSVPAFSAPEATAVTSTTGFRRGTLVRIWQGTPTPLLKVVSDVDPVDRLLVWLGPRPEDRLPYDAPLSLPPGYDLDQPLFIESIEYTLVVKERGTVRAVYEGLSLVPEDAENYGPARLPSFVPPTTLDTARGIPSAPPLVVIRELRTDLTQTPQPLAPAVEELALGGGTDGLAILSTYDFIGEEISPLDSDVVQRGKRRGLRALEDVDEVAIVAVPDINVQPVIPPAIVPLPPCMPDPCLPGAPDMPVPPRPPAELELPPLFTEAQVMQVQAAMVEQCERRRDRIALLDPPIATVNNPALGIGAVRAWRKRFESKYAALYYPWVLVAEPLRPAPALTRAVPPSGHVAGQYANTDFEVGVHKAPANNPLSWVQDVTVPVGDTEHGLLNTEGINVLKVLRGRGVRIMGARTVSSDPDWRYVNVRRLIMMIEKAVYICTQWAVFEPNDHITRAKMHLSLTGFLAALWQQGALMGKEIKEAFFVRCDEGNNPPDARANGQLLAEVGVAPSKPFEFVVLRVGRTQNEFEVREAALLRPAR